MKASLVFLPIAFCAMAQPARQLVHSDSSVRRIALVIGNDAYPGKPLHNAANDARSMKSALEDARFTVQIYTDTTQQQMETAIDDFTAGVNPGDIALFFYAGHGMQINDQNYLIPVDFRARTAVDAKYKAYPAQRVQERLEEAGARMQILIMDACRNNPYRSWRGGSEGLAAMQAGRGTYIAFATSPGKTAADNPDGKNGLFTGELVTVLRDPGLSIDQVFNRVREQVHRVSQGKQLPWSTSSVTGEFYFRANMENTFPPRESKVAPPRDLSGERELAFWDSIKDENHAALLEEYLRTYPTGTFASIAKAKLNRLKAPPAPATSAVAPVQTHAHNLPSVFRIEAGTRVWIRLKSIDPGAGGDFQFQGSVLLPVTQGGLVLLDRDTELHGSGSVDKERTSLRVTEIVSRGATYILKSKGGAMATPRHGAGGAVKFDSGHVYELWLGSASTYEKISGESGQPKR